MVDKAQFTYAPLDRAEDGQRAFRLLTILPDTEQAAVQCRLENILCDNDPTSQRAGNSLSSQPSRSSRKPRKSAAQFRRKSKLSQRRRGQDAPSVPLDSYEAISYAWGSQISEAQILLNGQPFGITPTLELALRRLRYLRLPRKVWIDAICIDQENPEEKVGQIRQMKNIFADAERVIVWLGESSADSDLGLAFAKELSILGIAEGGLVAADFSYGVPSAAKKLLSTSYIPSWIALHRLLSRSWWLRAWVVQEVVVAKNVMFLCGGTCISWDALSQAIIINRRAFHDFVLLKNESKHNIHSAEHFISSNIHCQAALDIVDNREKGGEPSKNRNLGDDGSLQWIYGNRLRLCEFPHDQIYSILGLASKIFQDSIVINYSQPIDYLYRSVVKASVDESKSLNILAHSQHSVWHPNLPSWMPDWQLQQRCVIFTDNLLNRSWKAYARFTSDLSKLRVKGIVVDAVVETQLEQQLLPGLSKLNTTLDASENLAIKPDSVCHWILDPQILHQLFIPALSRWCIDDMTGPNLSLLNVFVKLLSMKRSPNSFDPEWHSKTTLARSSNDRQLPGVTEFQKIQEVIEDLLISRTVIRTENYLAIAPDVTQPTDLVCLISGFYAPVVLRPQTDGTYIFIGDAFIGSDTPGQDSKYKQVDDDMLSKLEYIVLV
ncbi:hypothetical protein BP6252_06046 [Coleophoma cylindrospora]|uniref:Heterokaryon incompatibility domain-containing protein n=1 Tax=Coleophoma cylindrospora TaxID=1849047 RepID=A0A3D8RLX5_9HELO|nr:hypothetical protein BP6252_06046 [Coleophoma cylindrospora]